MMDGLLHLACLGTLIYIQLSYTQEIMLIYNLIPISQFPIPIPMFANTITTLPHSYNYIPMYECTGTIHVYSSVVII